MTHGIFPERIETDRLVFVRIDHDRVDPFEFYEFVASDAWQGDATEHMPWYRFATLEDVVRFLDHSEEQWADRETARYLLRSTDADGDIVGVTGYGPEWEKHRAGSGIVLSKNHWGNEYGLERASVFVEMTFEKYDLDAFYTTCAADNEPSRRMIEKYVEKYGGRHEGLLRQHSPRPSGEVTDQHRYSIVRSEYEDATAKMETMDYEMEW